MDANKKAILTVDWEKASVGRTVLAAYMVVGVILSAVNPFFRNIFIFSTYLFTVVTIIAAFSAHEDAKNGVRREGPKKEHWLNSKRMHFIFVGVIVITAGLKMALFTTTLCWLISWACFYITNKAMKETYITKGKEE